MGIKLQYNPSTNKIHYTAATNKVQVVDDFPTPPPGNPCTCWGDEKPYGPLPVPSELQVIISGVLKGDLWVPADGEPINGTFTIEQSTLPVLSCFFFKDSDPTLSIPLTSGLGLLTARNVENSTYFNAGSFSNCWTSVSNVFTDQTIEKFYSGTMTLVFP